MHANWYSMELVVDGKPLREHLHEGKMHVAGELGSNYAIRVTNRSDRRILAVVSVDGLSVLNGEKAASDGDGYVLERYATIDIPGWRRTNDEVAAFQFGNAPEAYATQMKEGGNLGVIGAALFREKRTIRTKGIMRGAPMMASPGGGDAGCGGTVTLESLGGNTSLDCDVTPCSGSSPMGTQYGASLEHHVHTVTFNREDSPAATMTLYYDSAENLRRKGIRLDDPSASTSPNPFPGDKVGCPAPPGWSR